MVDPLQQRILVVEDSRTYATLLKRRISQRLPFRITVATTLAEAKEVLEKEKDYIFLAVLDLNLPDAPNGEIVDLIVSYGISAVVLTATFSDKVREHIISKNVIDYIIKESARDIDYIVDLIKRIRLNQKTKLLVVDDSSTFRYTLRKYLNIYKFIVFEAKDGVEALEVLDEHPDIRMVITDFNMPRMDGFELISKIRKNYSKEKLAVIGLSSSTGGSLSARFLKRGANDVLAKPFSKEEFFVRINQNLELIELIGEIQDASNRDYLTGLYNRRYFYDVGSKFYENARRNHITLTVAMIDIDYFKVVNDSYGHDAGDVTIKHVANLLGERLRKTDIIARFGGEEFCIMAANMDPDYVYDIFDSIRETLAESAIEYNDKSFKITFSVGLTSDLENSLPNMIRTADEMLYQAKDKGRNRVVMNTEQVNYATS